MLAKPLPFLLTAQLVLTGCGGPSSQAIKLWNEACSTDAGTHITQTVGGVSSFIYEGETREQVETFRRKEVTAFPTLPVFSSYDLKSGSSFFFATPPLFLLFDARTARYSSVEITVPSDGIYGKYFSRIDLSAGHYRVSVAQRSHPRCMNFGGYTGPEGTERFAASRCLVATPIPKLTARYKVTHSKHSWRDEVSDVEREIYVVTDTRTGVVIARHAYHTLSWIQPTLGLPDWKSRSCPSDEAAIDIRAVLQPGDAK